MITELELTQTIYNFFNFGNIISTTHLLTNILPFILILFFGLFAIYQKRYILIGISLIATAFGFVLKEIITIFYQRARPYEVLNLGIKANLTENSFFSTHTYLAFIVAFFIFFLTDKKWVRITAIVLATLTAVSRLILAQHYISDIIAGFLIALIIYLISKKIYEKYFEQRYIKEEK